MKSEFSSVIEKKHAKNQGNTFVQLTHIGYELAKEKKVESIELQFFDNIFRKITQSSCVVDNQKKKSEDTDDLYKEVSLEITKMDLLNAYGIQCKIVLH